jgi:predicted metal-dependent hydrolase
VVVRSPTDAVARAHELLRAARPFHAHEVLEDAWKQRPEAERDLWQGLAQIAVGLTHALRGNASGAVTLLRRGAQRAGSYRGDAHGIDLAAVRRHASTLADTIERDGLDGVPAADLRPGLIARLG